MRGRAKARPYMRRAKARHYIWAWKLSVGCGFVVPGAEVEAGAGSSVYGVCVRRKTGPQGLKPGTKDLRPKGLRYNGTTEVVP
jgi:hypothetical protein